MFQPLKSFPINHQFSWKTDHHVYDHISIFYRWNCIWSQTVETIEIELKSFSPSNNHQKTFSRAVFGLVMDFLLPHIYFKYFFLVWAATFCDLKVNFTHFSTEMGQFCRYFGRIDLDSSTKRLFGRRSFAYWLKNVMYYRKIEKCQVNFGNFPRKWDLLTFFFL